MTWEPPPITVIATTYFPPGTDGHKRAEAADAAIISWASGLRYAGPLHLHVADDGSAYPPPDLMWRGEITHSRQDRGGVGASLNAGCDAAFARPRGLALYLVDDWELQAPLDLTGYARVLDEPGTGRWPFSMIRLGIAHPDLTGRIEYHGVDADYIMRLDRHHFAFGHRPALYHRRLIENYGRFAEGVNAYDCERLYAEQVHAREGGAPSDIGLGLLHYWHHNNEIELAGIKP